MRERTGLLSRLRRSSELREEVVQETHTFSPESAHFLNLLGYQTFVLGTDSTEDLETRGMWGSKIEKRMRKFVGGKMPCIIEVAVRQGEIIIEPFVSDHQGQLRKINEKSEEFSQRVPGAKVIMGDARLYFHLDKEYEEREGKPLLKRQFVRTTTDTTRKLPEILDMMFGTQDMAIVGRRKRSGPLQVKNYPQSPSVFYQPGYDFVADFVFELDGSNYPKFPIYIYTIPLVVPETYAASLDREVPLSA